jgi:mannose-6-phosphate isomerase-like protein (cupin superfamily)
MTAPYTHKQLTDVEDAAPRFGMEGTQEARFAGGDLDAADTGVSHHRLHPGKRQPFGHKHDDAEEVYVVLAGTGRLKLDDDIIDVRPLDAIRVSPKVTRQFDAGSDGLEWLAFGPHREGDGEIIPDWWQG